MSSRPGLVRIATGSGALFAAAGLQMLFFLGTAKVLKPTEFGYLSAVWAYALPVAELIGLGAIDYLIQRVSRHPPLFPLMFGGALTAILWTVPLIVPLVVLLRLLLPAEVALSTIVLLCISELILMRLVLLGEQSMIAHGQVPLANVQRMFVALMRLLAIVGLYVGGGHVTLDRFAGVYLLATAITALLVLAFIARRYGMPRRRGGIGAIFRPSFALHNLGRAVALSVDRISLSLVLPFASLGIYTAGTRVLQVGTIPVLALFRDTYGGFFRAGRGGIEGAIGYMKELRSRAIGIALGSTLAAMAFALLMPLLLGASYAASMPVGLIVALSTLPIAAQYAAGDVLTGSDRQAIRARITLGSLIVAAPLMIGGALAFGIIGAAVANVAVQILTACALVAAIARERRRER